MLNRFSGTAPTVKVWPLALTVWLSTSTVTMSPPVTTSWMPSQVSSRIPLLNALRKKMRAKLLAMMQRTPLWLKTVAACSREEPQPKLVPAMRISPGCTVEPNSGLSSSKAYFFISSMVGMVPRLPGMMVSVSISLPKVHTLPLKIFSIVCPLLYSVRVNEAQATVSTDVV